MVADRRHLPCGCSFAATPKGVIASWKHVHGRRPWWKRAIATVLAFFLAGCVAAPGYSDYKAYAEMLATGTIKDMQNTHDLEAQGMKAAACGITLGAWTRLPRNDQRAFLLMCSGQDIGGASYLPYPLP